MQDTFTSTPTSSLRRRSGPVGGVMAGLAHKLGVDPTLLRVGTAVATLVAGPIVVLGYLLAWLFVPVDESLPAHDRPSSAPAVLLGIVAAVIAFQVVFGFITSLPFTWLALGAIAIYWFFIRD